MLPEVISPKVITVFSRYKVMTKETFCCPLRTKYLVLLSSCKALPFITIGYLEASKNSRCTRIHSTKNTIKDAKNMSKGIFPHHAKEVQLEVTTSNHWSCIKNCWLGNKQQQSPVVNKINVTGKGRSLWTPVIPFYKSGTDNLTKETKGSTWFLFSLSLGCKCKKKKLKQNVT